MIKDKLIASGIFIYNDYFNKYLEIIETNKNNKMIKFITQKHHIIPSSYYRHQKINVDNSKENLVNLSYINHIFAHYYLCLCSKGWFKYCAYKAFLYLIKRIDMINKTDNKSEKIFIEKNFTKEFFERLPYFKKIYEQDKLFESIKNKGGKWMNNGVKQQYVPPNKIQFFINKNYKIGKLPITEKQRQKFKERKGWNKGLTKETSEILRLNGIKISKANKGRKLSETTRQKMSQKLKGRVAYNKGTKMTDEQKQKCKNTFFKKGHIPWNKGKHFSEEIRHKMSISAKIRCKRKRKNL